MRSANVVGRYAADDPHAPALILASHYDTVRNAGKYDGRLGVLVALVVADRLRRRGRRLPFHLDVIAFSEEEGVRFASTYLGSSAVAGRFDPGLLERRDADGRHVGGGMSAAGAGSRRHSGAGAAAARTSLGYLEVHIEQGPVLLQEGSAGRDRERDRRHGALHGHDSRHAGACRHRADGAAP